MLERNEKLNTVGKAVLVFETICDANRPLSVKEIADAVGLNKSSLHHHIRTLNDCGYLQQDPDTRKYDIGLGLVRVGQAYLQRLDVRDRGHIFLKQLSEDLNETAHMLVLDHDHAVYVDKVEAQQKAGALRCSSFIGMRTDVFSTACGKVLLSELENETSEPILNSMELYPITPFTLTTLDELKKELALTNERGYGLDLQEHSLGLQCIAVPIYDLDGNCVAAISVSSPVASVSQDMLESHVLKKLQETADKISMAMGHRPKLS